MCAAAVILTCSHQSVDVMAVASLGTFSAAVVDLFRQDQTH